jgi:hypothetical protein
LNTIKWFLENFSSISSFSFEAFLFLYLLAYMFLSLYSSLIYFSPLIITLTHLTSSQIWKIYINFERKMRKKKAPSIHKWWSASTTTRRRIFGFNYDNTIINCPYINFCILFGHHYFCILFYSIKSSRFLTNLLRTLIPNYNKIFLRFSPFLVKNRLIGRRLLLTVNVIHSQNHTLV